MNFGGLVLEILQKYHNYAYQPPVATIKDLKISFLLQLVYEYILVGDKKGLVIFTLICKCGKRLCDGHESKKLYLNLYTSKIHNSNCHWLF